MCWFVAADEGVLTVQLNLATLALTPTFVYEMPAPAIADGADLGSLETSVRYFLRPIVYTKLGEEVRAAAIVSAV